MHNLPAMDNYRKQIIAAWILSMGVVIIFSLQPGSHEPTPFMHADKVGHFLAYGWLGLLPWLAFAERKHRMCGSLAVIALGGAMEICQSFVPLRMASFGDMAANTLGACAGAALAHAFKRNREVA